MGELQHVAGFPRMDCETSHFLLGRKKNRTDHQPYDLYHLIPSYFDGAKNKETIKIHWVTIIINQQGFEPCFLLPYWCHIAPPSSPRRLHLRPPTLGCCNDRHFHSTGAVAGDLPKRWRKRWMMIEATKKSPLPWTFWKGVLWQNVHKKGDVTWCHLEKCGSNQHEHVETCGKWLSMMNYPTEQVIAKWWSYQCHLTDKQWRYKPETMWIHWT